MEWLVVLGLTLVLIFLCDRSDRKFHRYCDGLMGDQPEPKQIRRTDPPLKAVSGQGERRWEN